MKNNMFFFRADGNSKIGTGHIMRCLSIAHDIMELGGECEFVCADDTYKGMIEDNGIKVNVLGTVWNELDDETEIFARFLQSENAGAVLIDTYMVTAGYLERIKQICHTIYIDDLGQMIYPCSTLINYTLYYKDMGYERYKDTVMLLGPEYTPMRACFRNVSHSAINRTEPSVLITTGGTDPNNYSEKIADSLISSIDARKYRITILCGRFNENYSRLALKYSDNPKVNILKNVYDVTDIFLNTDIVVTASGTTLFELAACSAPAVCFVLADNQIKNSAAFAEEGMYFAGDIRNDENCLSRICDGVNYWINGKDIYEKYSRNLRVKFDGMGSRRIAHYIMGLSEK
ncbi:MAG: UDP-2,4-diacetamido-2,4,6-trideoxy-beta-L-altropyranose hydrolase [Oscillospiraceae bacterium]|nr:UDP-2,4-diacetamido-2,4,6-trideoxy-beta-L-altropyranose hydrolase [Oscillospiraceae bacterium]